MQSGAATVIELLGWSAVAIAGALMITQAVGWAGFRLLAVVHSLTPFIVVAMAPVAVGAALGRQFVLSVAAVVVILAGLVLALPLLFPKGQPPVADGALGVRIATLNLLYLNKRVDEVAGDLRALELDVLVLIELTPAQRSVFEANALADGFPFRVEHAGRRAGGVAIWSSAPILADAQPPTVGETLDVTIDSTDGPIRIVAVHTPTPVSDFTAWRLDLDTIRAMSTNMPTPTVILGDFNASFWHPSFRKLLACGLTAAHDAAGRGFSTSWPTDVAIPAFVRLDHALTTNGLVSTIIEDIDVVGSDHRGFIVTVAPAQ